MNLTNATLTLPPDGFSSHSPQHKALMDGRWRTPDVLGSAGSFHKLALPPPLRRALALAGFKTPSPVQERAIPLARLGSDLVVQAKSGTGKTLVFAVACLERIDLSNGAPQAMVVCPTRELAQQSASEIARLSHNLPPPPASCGVFIGGVPVAVDQRTLRRKCQVVVGTPGRLAGLVRAKQLNTKTIKAMVLDEADQLFSQSMQSDVEFLLNNSPKDKQFLAFSATYTPQILAEIESRMRMPQRVMVSGCSNNLLGVRQCYKVVEEKGQEGGDVFEAKADALLLLFNSVSFHQALVFCNEQRQAAKLSEKLTRKGFPAEFISGWKPQDERGEAMEAMRGFRLRVIVSTDLMARGVDLERVNLVCNLDLPFSRATYVHRLGRTGRFGTLGLGVSFVTRAELIQLREFVESSGGSLEGLPSQIPEDWYAYELKAGEDKAAYNELLNAPTTAEPLRHFPEKPDSNALESGDVELLGFWNQFMGKRTDFWDLWDPYENPTEQKASVSQDPANAESSQMAVSKEKISPTEKNDSYSSFGVVYSEEGDPSEAASGEMVNCETPKVVWRGGDLLSASSRDDLPLARENNLEICLDQALRASRYEHLCGPEKVECTHDRTSEERPCTLGEPSGEEPPCNMVGMDEEDELHEQAGRDGPDPSSSNDDDTYRAWLKAYNSWGDAYAQWYHKHQEWLASYHAWCGVAAHK